MTEPDAALADATAYLDAFGRVTMAWIWLLQARAAQSGAQNRHPGSADFYAGKLHAARYFVEIELPLAAVELVRLATQPSLPMAMQSKWF
jgi:butyryl-CoA dehydrogenase